MSITLRILLCLVSACTTIYMLWKVRHAKAQIEDTLFWLVFSIVLIVFGVFPDIVSAAASLIGIYSPVNFVFLSIIFILIIKLFLMTIKVSQLENKVNQLTQQVALKHIENEQVKSEKSLDKTAGKDYTDKVSQ